MKYRRRLADRIRDLADEAHRRGRKEIADDLHEAARREEALRPRKKANPVVEIRAQSLSDALHYLRAVLRYGGKSHSDLAIEAMLDAHWQAQRLRSVCERELGTRQR